ncbi:MAG: AbrB/MazE/SpoVT family DNA-binding domain-containing protein [Candidatus Bathyarchaeia archaeon]|jgi:AbrB family looped-hinge helix DNA binding protein
MVKFALEEEVKVTRKYQVTIPQSVRSELGVKIGDKLIVKSENKRIIMESPKRLSNPSDALWNLFGKPLDMDATKLVEESWKETPTSEPKKQHCEKRKEATD